MPIQITELHV